MGALSLVRLQPAGWTRVPGTGCELRWDGERVVVLYHRDATWNLSRLLRRHRLRR